MKSYKELLNQIVDLKEENKKILKENKKLEKLVYKDSVTDLYNQKFLYEVLDRKIQAYRRYKEEFSILFIDVDHFKQINDNHGHLVGSKVLVEVGELLKSKLRGTDYAFRYGGDEFVILLSRAKKTQAKTVAEKLRKAVEEAKFDRSKKITISIGIAHVPRNGKTVKKVLKIADQAMYESKKNGRNKVYSY